jgi:hypothetical protein
MQPLRSGTRGGRIRAGKVILEFPDPVKGVIDHQLQLTYDQGRDASTFADEVMVAVERFMNELITAFEQYFPERLKRQAAEQDEGVVPEGC